MKYIVVVNGSRREVEATSKAMAASAAITEADCQTEELDIKVFDMAECPKPTSAVQDFARKYTPFADVIALFETAHEEMVKYDRPPDDDFEHYVFEQVGIAIYGDDYFQWYNKAVSDAEARLEEH